MSTLLFFFLPWVILDVVVVVVVVNNADHTLVHSRVPLPKPSSVLSGQLELISFK